MLKPDIEVIVLSDSDETDSKDDVCDDRNASSISIDPTSFKSSNSDGYSGNTGEISNGFVKKRETHAQMSSNKSSAYVQHLAEICYTILNDQRWKNNLFSWEHGDDLSVVYSLAKLYDGKDIHKNKSNVDNYCEHDFSPSNDTDIERIIHLYCRMYHRKGPWFRLDDIFMRYYLKGNLLSGNEKNVQLQAGSDPHKEQVLEIMELFLNDVHKLLSLGFIRSFTNENECGIVIGNERMEGGILTNKERSVVLNKLGGTGGEHRNEILRQMKSQRSVLDAFLSKSSQTKILSSKTTNILLPVSHHLRPIILSKLSFLCNDYFKRMQANNGVSCQISSLDITKIWSSVNEDRCNAKIRFSDTCLSFLPSCIRLREKPLQSLRRFVRLYIIATAGAGNMRQGAWLSVFNDFKIDRNAQEKKKNSMIGPSNAYFADVPSWNKLIYPGLWHRLRLQEFSFLLKYEPLIQNLRDLRNSTFRDCQEKITLKDMYIDKHIQMIQIFKERHEFLEWEMSVEIRSQMDYLFAHVDAIKFLDRQTKKKSNRKDSRMDKNENSFDCNLDNRTKEITEIKFKDRLNICHRQDRLDIINKFLSNLDAHEIEVLTDRDLPSYVESLSVEIMDRYWIKEGNEYNESPKNLIAFLSVISGLIFCLRAHFISSNEVDFLMKRPWIRHLRWEAVLAVVIWDGISIIEKSGCYELATFLLETILFGNSDVLSNASAEKDGPNRESLKFFSMLNENKFKQKDDGTNLRFVIFLMSRRTRGKAVERLLIDKTHVARKEEKKLQANLSKKRKSKTGSPTKNKIQMLCRKLISEEGIRASIPFSSIRNLSKRLKCPLIETLQGIWNPEMIELNIRLENNKISTPGNQQNENKTNKKLKKEKKSYTDWAPNTDRSVGVSMNNEIGARCTFIGWEDGNKNNIMHRSLNVEELALEEYASGRLPNVEKGGSVSGGWVGWHDEGGHARALFRILCMEKLLSFECDQFSQFAYEDWTIYLTPYQSAPLDLHVGYSYAATSKDDGNSFTIRSFYERRRFMIEKYLVELENMSGNEICSKLHKNVKKRLTDLGEKNKDIFLARDLDEIRTLSMIGCGLGGRMMANIFRCLSFDYRHYSGGLPDLLLVKATIKNKKESNTQSLVPLDQWVGEAFGNLHLHSRKSSDLSRLLIDRDDEFLGCEKGSDISMTLRNRNKDKNIVRHCLGNGEINDDSPGDYDNNSHKYPKMPDKLLLSFQEEDIAVQCMFVELLRNG